MKFRFFTFLSIFAFVTGACDSRAHIVFSNTVHDFGKARVESTLTHTFTFTNSGNATLIIERIRSG